MINKLFNKFKMATENVKKMDLYNRNKYINGKYIKFLETVKYKILKVKMLKASKLRVLNPKPFINRTPLDKGFC